MKLSFFLKITVFSLAFLCYTKGFSQKNNILQNYDFRVGEKNTALNNGPLDLNQYDNNIVDGRNKFYKENKEFKKGNVFYDGQEYYQKDLKYDLYQDILIYKPEGAMASIGIDLIVEKVDYFAIDGELFVNLNHYSLFRNKQDYQGYWQKIEDEKDQVLYIKFRKKKNEFYENRKVYYTFSQSVDAIIVDQQKIINLDDEKAVVAHFPSRKTEIKKFYDSKNSLKREDPAAYYKDLYQLITSKF